MKSYSRKSYSSGFNRQYTYNNWRGRADATSNRDCLNNKINLMRMPYNRHHKNMMNSTLKERHIQLSHLIWFHLSFLFGFIEGKLKERHFNNKDDF